MKHFILLKEVDFLVFVDFICHKIRHNSRCMVYATVGEIYNALLKQQIYCIERVETKTNIVLMYLKRYPATSFLKFPILCNVIRCP